MTTAETASVVKKDGFGRIVARALEDTVVIGVGESMQWFLSLVNTGNFESDLKLAQEFKNAIGSSGNRVDLLPEVQMKIDEFSGQIQKTGFDPRAALVAAGIIAFARVFSEPTLIKMARKNKEKGKGPVNALIAVDKFWLATETFLIANAANTLFNGWTKDEAGQVLTLVGGVIGALAFARGVGGITDKLKKKEIKK